MIMSRQDVQPSSPPCPYAHRRHQGREQYFYVLLLARQQSWRLRSHEEKGVSCGRRIFCFDLMR
jgi:hypothetical protein